MIQGAPLVLLTLVLLWAPLPASAVQSLVQGPYLQSQTTTGINVRWRQGESDACEVCYDEVLGDVAATCETIGADTECDVTLTGLTIDTKYYYSVGDDDPEVIAGPDADHWFKTQPVVDSTDHVRFWFMADPHHYAGDETGLQASIAGMVSWQGTNLPDFIVTGGDNMGVLGGATPWDELMTSDFFPSLATQLQTIPLWPATGNHDPLSDYTDLFTLPTAGEAGGVRSDTEAYYSFDFGNMHFVILSMAGFEGGGDQQTWFEADLAANDQEWTFVVSHYPPYTDGFFPSDELVISEQLRLNFVPLADEYGVDVWASGHSHGQERSFLIKGHYGASNTFDPGTMAVSTSYGGCCKGPAYTKVGGGPVEDSGIVYIVSGSTSMIGHWNEDIGDFEHPVMVSHVTGFTKNHTGDGLQGFYVFDVTDQQLDGYYVGIDGAAKDAFQMIKTAP